MYYNSLGAPNYCTQNNYDTTPRFSSLTFFRPGHVRFANCCLKPGRMPLPKALCGPWEGLQTSPKRRPKMGKLVPKISSKPTWYPLVNDHIAIAGISPIFNRKIIDSIRGPHFPASYVIVYQVFFGMYGTIQVFCSAFCPSESSIPQDPLLQKDAVRMGLNVMSQGC